MSIYAITGGIGSGKSVVSQILRIMGYKVYDSDRMAKSLMNSDHCLKQKLIDAFGNDVYLGDQLNRKLLASIVFADKQKLQLLNSIVHPAVISDMLKWAEPEHRSGRSVFVETAIAHESGIDNVVDGIIIVEAPEYIRVDRVMKRSCLSREEVTARIDAQRVVAEHVCREIIINDGITPILPQVESLKILRLNSPNP